MTLSQPRPCSTGRCAGNRRGVILRVPTVAQDGKWNTRGLHVRLGSPMLGRQAQDRRVRAEYTTVNDALHTGLLRHFNDIAMLGNAPLARTLDGVKIASAGEDFIAEPLEVELAEAVS